MTDGAKIKLEIASVEDVPCFDIWIGSDYRRRLAEWDARTNVCSGILHVMGESHYGEASENTNRVTIDTFEHLAFTGYPFFNTCLSIVVNKPAADLDPPVDWQSYAFSNFVQDMLPPENRRPSEQHWAKARRTFFAQLATTRPRQLLVVGREQWEALPTAGGTRLGKLPGEVEVDDAWLYSYEVDGSVYFTVAIWAYHPSSRGLLDIKTAQERVRTVTLNCWNIQSQITSEDGSWFLEPW